jgi:hypothetical protein
MVIEASSGGEGTPRYHVLYIKVGVYPVWTG